MLVHTPLYAISSCQSNSFSAVGIGDGIAVYNPRGTLLGKIFTGPPGSANFIWGGDGRYVSCFISLRTC